MLELLQCGFDLLKNPLGEGSLLLHEFMSPQFSHLQGQCLSPDWHTRQDKDRIYRQGRPKGGTEPAKPKLDPGMWGDGFEQGNPHATGPLVIRMGQCLAHSKCPERETRSHCMSTLNCTLCCHEEVGSPFLAPGRRSTRPRCRKDSRRR